MIDATLEHCLIVYKNQEVQVTSKQLKRIHKHLQAAYADVVQIEIVEDEYRQILYSPCHLWEILLEDYGVSNDDVKFN